MSALGKALGVVAGAVTRSANCPDYNILQNNGKIAHQEVPHAHFHIIPKPNLISGLGVQWPCTTVSSAKLEQIRDEIVAAL